MSKINLPLPSTCRWRRVDDDQRATCGVLASLIGKPSRVAEVSLAQCEACCESFPPTPARLNPITASILYAGLRQDEHGDQRVADDPGGRLRALAFDALLTEHAPVQQSAPRRVWQRCCFLGTADEVPASFEEGTLPCHHPRHEFTTARQCKRCHDWSASRPLSRPLKLEEIVPPPGRSDSVQYWAVGVTTAPRRQPTLEACLEGLIRAGWDDVHLFLDGTVRVPDAYAHLPTTWRENAVGACPAWVLALAELVALHPQADAFAIFQDDVLPHYGDSLRQYLERALWPTQHSGLVSLYHPGVSRKRGWQVMPANWDWGTFAVVFSPGAARAFLSDSHVLRRALPTERGQHLPIPELLREWIHRRAVPTHCPYPSLVQHIGAASTIHTHADLTGHRSAAWFSADVDQPRADEDSLADFDESAFPCSPSDEVTYQDRVQRGRERMRDSSAVICGSGRNVRVHLPRSAARIERLGGMFADYRVVLDDDDSVDATREFLDDWERANPRLDVVRASLDARQRSRRDTVRAAALSDSRNRYLDRLRDRYSGFPYVIVVDLDLVGGWSYDGIANTFGHDDWDFVGSYGIEYLPYPPQEPAVRMHCDCRALRAAPGSAARQWLSDHRDPLRRGMPMLEVDSCFGGLGVYRTPCLMTNRYVGGDCEHVALHQQLRESGFRRLFLNPSQIVCRSVLIH